jgi:hypothetical protein
MVNNTLTIITPFNLIEVIAPLGFIIQCKPFHNVTLALIWFKSWTWHISFLKMCVHVYIGFDLCISMSASKFMQLPKSGDFNVRHL